MCQSLTATAGNILVDVELLGSAGGWAAEITTDSESFLDLVQMSGVAGDDVLTIRYGENTTASSRTGTVTLTATGGTGTAQDTVLTLTQSAGADHTFAPTHTYAPALVSGNLTAEGGTISTTFVLGGGADRWNAEESLDYVSLSPEDGDASTPVVVSYDANATFVAREVVVSITNDRSEGCFYHRMMSLLPKKALKG